jgi:hypothetical protein
VGKKGRRRRRRKSGVGVVCQVRGIRLLKGGGEKDKKKN